MFSFVSVFWDAWGTSSGVTSFSSSVQQVWSIGVSSGLGEGVFCVEMIFYAKRVNARTQSGEERLLRASLFKWRMEEQDLLAEMEYFSDLISFGRCLSVPLWSLFRIHECFVLLESAWLHPCRKSTLWSTPSPKNLGSCRKRHLTHTLSSRRREAQWEKVEPSCIVKFLSVRSLNVTREIMKEKYSTGLNEFNGF